MNDFNPYEAVHRSRKVDKIVDALYDHFPEVQVDKGYARALPVAVALMSASDWAQLCLQVGVREGSEATREQVVALLKIDNRSRSYPKAIGPYSTPDGL